MPCLAYQWSGQKLNPLLHASYQCTTALEREWARGLKVPIEVKLKTSTSESVGKEYTTTVSWFNSKDLLIAVSQERRAVVAKVDRFHIWERKTLVGLVAFRLR